MALHISIKHLQISKANNQLALVVAAAVVVTIFCLVSAKDLLSQSAYQRKVLAAKNSAAKQLKDNVDAANQLVTQYKVFEQGNPNLIGGQGGSDPGNGPSDGDNARIVLDALPSQYDFPALTSSLEKLLSLENVKIQGIGGTDDGDQVTADSGQPGQVQATPIPFSVDFLTDYDTSKKMIQDFERSIRPIDILQLEMTGKSGAMHITVNANTYYQPATNFSVGSEAVK